ncbi:LAFE_0C07074g1_1 [Lachancea fermentati]|uniref:LAFE_0C07074g1_1 n=1 Tax=Lachancea fermentati TaxID=4955 RepID=A0A1G4MA35_LACFM|nr:LAFE_0C07074g1_1 [Lachancea fermentati]
MRLSSLVTATVFFSTALCLPVRSTNPLPSGTSVPDEAILAFIDLTEDDDVAVVRASNDTNSGLLLVNTTLLAAMEHDHEAQAHKRDAEPWHWLRLSSGQPLYKRAAAPWHWLRLGKGQPLY